MAYATYHGKRVSKAHAAVLNAYERKYGAPAQVNQGARTIAEQTAFWNHYRKYGSPLAAFPAPGAPHIKYGQAHHALDINSGSGVGQSQHVASYYRSLGISVAFNVPSEAWHMDTLDKNALLRAAKKVGVPVLRRGSRGAEVVRLKKLLYAKGIRNFTGKRNSNRYWPVFNQWTRAAVIRFQKAHGLKGDGIVGPATWRKLK